MESGGACAKRRSDGPACRRLVATTRTRTGLSGRHSLLLTTLRRRRRQYTEGKTGCGVVSSLSLFPMAAGPDDRSAQHSTLGVSSPHRRRPTPMAVRQTVGRPASQPPVRER
ncbi:unnamed protein product [Macrosiphum euphorbiae]|uniref:Uncharacterized protein n=1 Tax=Macrosiphum euphorbiae TaxID=13131 RepID=A0AAV0VNN9_9HEMI|nr:unnamed protein product [Macrosiphum euphorbiae]